MKVIKQGDGEIFAFRHWFRWYFHLNKSMYATTKEREDNDQTNT